MVDKILVPVDGSDKSRKALELAKSIYPDSGIVLLHVIEVSKFEGDVGWMTSEKKIIEQRRETVEKMFDEVLSETGGHEGGVQTEIKTGEAARTIVEYIDSNSIGHTVIGSHGRKGVSRVLLGSVAENVARRSHTPVTIVR